jgi:CRISPR-associated protein Csb3
MSQVPEPAIRVRVDPTNPGEFFACCGLLELADRLWGGVEAWFGDDSFLIKVDGAEASLFTLLSAAHDIRLVETEENLNEEDQSEEQDGLDRESTALTIVSPVSLRLDWWADKSLKTWAGSMDARKIFLAMCNAIDAHHENPLNQQQIVFDAAVETPVRAQGKHAKAKKREPFYFDGRRGAAAWSIDVGFSPDSLKLTTAACPAVEAMCFIGLQRCRPKPTVTPRVFDYYLWRVPLDIRIVPAAVCGLLPYVQNLGFRFENTFRTDQRKHKAFTPATPIARSY